MRGKEFVNVINLKSEFLKYIIGNFANIIPILLTQSKFYTTVVNERFNLMFHIF
jgi:hypothetical protein